MKKLLTILLSLISVICITFSFAACTESQTDGQQDEVNDSENQTDGQQNEANGGSSGEIVTGYFYSVEYAYAKGYITHDEAMSIAYYQNGGVNFNVDAPDEPFTPLPIIPENLSNQTANSIKQTYLNEHYDDEDNAELSWVNIDKYYGTYNGYVAVMLSGKNISFEQKVWTERFADIAIRYNDSNRICIWKEVEKPVEVNGKFYLLETAYENGWLNEDDLKSIACCYNSAYDDNPYTGLYEEPSDELSEKIEKELKQAYLEHIVKYSTLPIDGVTINKYYGTYSDNIVVKIYSEYVCIDPIIKDEVYIGGVLFRHYWDAQTYVYHIEQTDEAKSEKGVFYTVTEAYENGYLNYQQLMSIAYHRNGGTEGNEAIMGGNYKLLPINPVELSTATENAIKQTYIDTFLKKYEEANIAEVHIENYYGTYKGCVAVIMTSDYFGYTAAVWTETVDNVNIVYNYGNRIYIWVPESKQRDLSADDIATIKLRHEPYIEENFYDNSVCVILRSKYDYLTEISFNDLKIVEEVSHISYVDLYTEEILYSKDGKIPLGKFRLFKIVLEEHSKEKVLEVIKLLETLDMVLCADPDYIYYAVND